MADNNTTDAVTRYALNSAHWLRPKPKPLFYVDFILNETIKQELEASGQYTRDNFNTIQEQLSKVVRLADRPSMQIDNEVKNQYNKKTIIRGKLVYNPCRFTFIDSVDSSSVAMFMQMLHCEYNDFAIRSESQLAQFQNKDVSQLTGTDWSFGTIHTRGGDKGGNLLSRIDIYEFFDNRISMFNLQNPVLKSAEFDPRDRESSAPSEFTMVFDYEFLTNRYYGSNTYGDMPVLGAPITKEIADKVKISWNGSTVQTSSYLPNATSGYANTTPTMTSNTVTSSNVTLRIPGTNIPLVIQNLS
jgi:hypothetical protein